MNKIEEVLSIVYTGPLDEFPILDKISAFGGLAIHQVPLLSLEPGFQLGDFMNSEHVSSAHEAVMIDVTPPGTLPERALCVVWKVSFKGGGAAVLALKVTGRGDDDQFNDLQIRGAAAVVKEPILVDLVVQLFVEQQRSAAWDELLAIAKQMKALRVQLDQVFQDPDQNAAMRKEQDQALGLVD